MGIPIQAVTIYMGHNCIGHNYIGHDYIGHNGGATFRRSLGTSESLNQSNVISAIGPSADLFLASFRGMPTANAEG